MIKSRSSKEAYDRYEDAVVALFMELYATALTEKLEKQDATTEELDFPIKLDQRCKQLIKKQSAKQACKNILRAAKQITQTAAIFAVVALAITSVMFVSVKAFREKVVNYYISHNDGHWSISKDQPYKTEDINHTITFDKDDPLKGLIPADYAITSISNANNRRVTATYENSSKQYIRFLSLPYTASLYTDMEKAEVSKETTILGNDAVITIKNGVTQVVWVNESTNMMYLLVADQLQEDELISIAKHLIFEMDK